MRKLYFPFSLGVTDFNRISEIKYSTCLIAFLFIRFKHCRSYDLMFPPNSKRNHFLTFNRVPSAVLHKYEFDRRHAEVAANATYLRITPAVIYYISLLEIPSANDKNILNVIVCVAACLSIYLCAVQLINVAFDAGTRCNKIFCWKK